MFLTYSVLSIKCITIVVLLINGTISNPISPFIFLTAPNGEQLANFNLTMPDGVGVVNIDLKMKMMFQNKNVTKRTISEQVPTEIPKQHNEAAYSEFTIDDVIRAFKKNLRNSERKLGGILESDQPFYRHFLLQFKNTNVPVRCMYSPVFSHHSLTIDCAEYRQLQRERIYSNGEVESFTDSVHSERAENLIIEAESVNAYTQAYHMNILDSDEYEDDD